MASTTESKIYFFFQAPVNLSKRTRLKAFIQEIFKKEKVRLETLNYIFCMDKELLEINRRYLQHDYYTDIITFELSAKGEPVVGDIYISIERVKENALSRVEPIYKELLRVIFHGVLHLCGYKDKKAEQKKMMRLLEDTYLKAYLK